MVQLLLSAKQHRPFCNMASILSFVSRVYRVFNPPTIEKEPTTLRCGILGAAKIAPLAIINPARSHPEFSIDAVAARDEGKAKAFAKRYGIPKTYFGSTGYQELLDDPDIDVIYNPLPNGLHFEWTMKALKAGKHVLLEKPSTNSAEDTRRLFQYANEKGLVLLEAFHSRFHPAIFRLKEIVHSGELGNIKSIAAKFCIPKLFDENNIRCDFELGGGAYMDQGCYTLAVSRFIANAEPMDIISAHGISLENPKDEPRMRNIDTFMSASFTFPNDVTVHTEVGSRLPGVGFFHLIPHLPIINIEVTLEGGTVYLSNFVFPHIYHAITVSPKRGEGRIEKAYIFRNGRTKDEEWWPTYRYQLEAFVDKVKGRQPTSWMDGEDSESNMEWIENVYERAGFGVRPKSKFVMED